MATKVERWETEDGSIFGTEQEALSHEASNKRSAKLDKIISSFYYRDIAEEDIRDGLIKNAEELCDILSYYIP